MFRLLVTYGDRPPSIVSLPQPPYQSIAQIEEGLLGPSPVVFQTGNGPVQVDDAPILTATIQALINNRVVETKTISLFETRTVMAEQDIVTSEATPSETIPNPSNQSIEPVGDSTTGVPLTTPYPGPSEPTGQLIASGEVTLGNPTTDLPAQPAETGETIVAEETKEIQDDQKVIADATKLEEKDNSWRKEFDNSIQSQSAWEDRIIQKAHEREEELESLYNALDSSLTNLKEVKKDLLG